MSTHPYPVENRGGIVDLRQFGRKVYFIGFTLHRSIAAAIEIFVHGMRVFAGKQEDAFNSGPDAIQHSASGVDSDAIDKAISRMDAEELCAALNHAMYLHPDDPDTMYPAWFVELAREGVYLAGMVALHEDQHLRGECVVKFNEELIAFDSNDGHWVPAEALA